MMKHFFWRRFLINLACFLCVIVLVTAIIGTAVVTTMDRDIRSRMARNLDTSSSTITLLLDNGNIQRALLTFESSVSSTIRDVLENDRITYKDIPIRDLLKYTVYSPTILSECIESVYLYVPNAKENFLSSVQLVENLRTAVDRSWFADYAAGPAERDIWVKSRTEGHYSFETPRRVVSVYQRLAFSEGVLVLNLLPDALADAIDTQALHPDETALLFNDSGELLLSTNASTDAAPDYAYLTRNTTDEGISTCQFNGHDWLVTRRDISQYGLTYFLLSSRDSVFRSLRHILLLCGAAVLIAVLVSVLLSWDATRRNARRVETVIDLFARAEHGEQIPPLVEQDRDEYDLIINNIIKTFLSHSYLNLQLQNRYQEARIAQLTALQLQINPHFLFNTLQTIDFEVLKINQKYCDANVLIKRLSNILMYSLRNTDRPVTLGEEIERTRDYLFIQQYRRPAGALLCEWNCAAGIEDTPCLCMILQPFLENSIVHGERASGEPLRLRVKIQFTTDYKAVHIRIVDNGCGMSQERLAALLASTLQPADAIAGQHIGVRNTIKRLKLFCSDRLNFQIHSIYQIGTVIDFEIPIEI